MCVPSVKSDHLETFNAPVINDLDGGAPVLPCLKGQRVGSEVGLDQVGVDLGLEVLDKRFEAVFHHICDKEYLSWKEAASIIVRVQQPHGYLVGSPRFNLAGPGVVVIKAMDADAALAFVVARRHFLEFHVRLANQPE